MGSQQTGLNEGKVNDAIRQVTESQNHVMSELTKGFNDILKGMSDNWGTKDGVTWVTSSCVPALQDMGKQVAETLAKIGEVIQKVATAQASDTGNSMSINSAGTPALGGMNNNMKEKLSNGYVGIYEEFKADVDKYEAQCIEKVNTALAELQSKVIAKTDIAFNLVGQADKVSADCTIYINQVKNIINNGLTSLNADISAQVAKADTFVRDIQNAGLRGATGS